jgi:di/tripeptidase
LDGYRSGHSGGEIHKPHINAIIHLAETLLNFANSNKIDIKLVSFNAGPINNVIPVFAKCRIKMDKKYLSLLQNYFTESILLAKEISQGFEPNINCKISMVSPSVSYGLSDVDTNRVLMSLALCPNKVFIPQKDQKCMFSSSNIGFVQLDNETSTFKVDFKIRSFIDRDVKKNEKKIHLLMNHFG